MNDGLERRLVRAIGVRRLTASIINVTVGAGIFVLPAAIAASLGTAAPLAYLVCAAAMALIVTCIAAAGSRVSLTGGLYAYVEVALGPFIGFLAGLLYWLAASLSAASVASALAGSIGVVWDAAADGVPRAVVLVGLFSVVTLVNVRGVTSGAQLVELMTVAKLLPLVVLVGAGLAFGEMGPRSWLPLPEASAVGRASVLLIFAFVGLEVALVPSGEIRDPARNVPRAIGLALVATTTLYLLVQTVAQGVLGDAMGDYAAAPLAEVASRLLGAGGARLVFAGAAISMAGYISGDMLGTPRALFALARDGMLLAPLAAVHPRFRTPWIAIIVHAAIVCTMAVSSGFTELALLSSVAALTVYLLSVAAAWVLQRRNTRTSGTPFRLPAGPLIPALAAAVILWFLSQVTWREFALEGAVVAIASVVYLFRRRAAAVGPAKAGHHVRRL